MAEEIVRRIPLAAGQPQADERDRDAVGDDDGDVERSQRPSWRETKRGPREARASETTGILDFWARP